MKLNIPKPEGTVTGRIANAVSNIIDNPTWQWHIRVCNWRWGRRGKAIAYRVEATSEKNAVDLLGKRIGFRGKVVTRLRRGKLLTSV